METEDKGLRGIAPVKSRQWPWAFLAGSAILICGIVIGSAGTFLLLPRFFGPGPGGGRPEPTPDAILAHFRHDFGLSPEQEVAIRPILEESHEKMEAIRLQLDPQVEAIMNDTNAKISPLLNPRQKELLDKRFTEMRDKTRPHPKRGHAHQDGPTAPRHAR